MNAAHFKAIILQVASPAAPATPAPFMEWGLFAALAYASLRQLWQSFSHKDQEEAKLLTSLISDLRTDRRQLNDWLIATQTKQAELLERQAELLEKQAEKLDRIEELLVRIAERIAH